MSLHGVALTKMDRLMEYIATWINELQAQKMADKAYRQFGWVDSNANGFILGNQKILKDRVEFNPPSKTTVGLFPAFEPKGTIDEWREIIDFYNRPGFELHQYALCTGFGSILMEFIDDIACSALHLYSKESGLGKTTAMRAAASIWGDPEELVINEQDTHNTKMNRSEVLHTRYPATVLPWKAHAPEPLSPARKKPVNMISTKSHCRRLVTLGSASQMSTQPTRP